MSGDELKCRSKPPESKDFYVDFQSETDTLPETEFLENTGPSEHLGDVFPVLIILTGNSAGKTIKLNEQIIIGRANSVELTLDDKGVSRRHVRVECNEHGVLNLFDLGSKNGTFVGDEQVMNGAVKPGQVFRIGPNVTVQYELRNALALDLQTTLYQNATLDGLTGVLNKRSFQEGYRLLVQDVARRRGNLALLVIDGDRFKSVNDTLGHSAGDLVLKELAQRLKKHVRNGDLLARYGGEEFVLVARDCGPEQAAALAERVRLEVSSNPFPTSETGEESIPFTVSIGTACWRSGLTELALFDLADKALYKAKEHGRNRVVACHQL